MDPSSGESLPRAFETNFFLETGRLVSNTVSQFLSLLFHVHLFSRGYFPLLFFSLSFFLLLDFFKRYVISFFSYVLLFHVLLSIIFVIRNVISFFFFFCALIMESMSILRVLFSVRSGEKYCVTLFEMLRIIFVIFLKG